METTMIMLCLGGRNGSGLLHLNKNDNAIVIDLHESKGILIDFFVS